MFLNPSGEKAYTLVATPSPLKYRNSVQCVMNGFVLPYFYIYFPVFALELNCFKCESRARPSIRVRHPQYSLTAVWNFSPLLPWTPRAAWPWVAEELSSFFLETSALPCVRATYLGPDSQPSSLQFPSSQAGLCSKLRRTPKSPHRDARSMPGSCLEPHRITALG